MTKINMFLCLAGMLLIIFIMSLDANMMNNIDNIHHAALIILNSLISYGSMLLSLR
ncbi:hypothetical protein D3C76_1476330 [compost metagenome]